MELREADRAECAAYGLTSREAILMSIRNSVMAYAVEVDGEVAALWGYSCASFMSSSGAAWLLTTPVAGKHPKTFVAMSKGILAMLMTQFSSVEVLVHARYAKAIAWLRHIGFTPSRPDPTNPDFFYMQRTR